MTNFEVIADRIISAEGISFAIACSIHEHTGVSYGILQERREALKQAIVGALEDVHMDTVNAMRGVDPRLPAKDPETWNSSSTEIKRAKSPR